MCADRLIGQVEEIVLSFFQGRDDRFRRPLRSAYDVRNALDEETIEEIKDRIWYIVQTEYIRWYYIADAVRDMIGNTDEDEEEDEED
jgi:hypothetical protein